MSDFKHIYTHDADRYEALVVREDYRGNLLPALQALHTLYSVDVAEFGAGTGRLTRLLRPFARSIVATDASAAMLRVARDELEDAADGAETNSVRLAVADNRALPLRSASVDLSIAGWSFGHAVGWYPDRWRGLIGDMLAEMERLTRAGGAVIVIETLGTGVETPTPPPSLEPYYGMLSELGFLSTWVRTDYRFASLDEAVSLTRFFFGDALADQVRRNAWVILPECTGIWWREV